MITPETPTVVSTAKPAGQPGYFLARARPLKLVVYQWWGWVGWQAPPGVQETPRPTGTIARIKQKAGVALSVSGFAGSHQTVLMAHNRQ